MVKREIAEKLDLDITAIDFNEAQREKINAIVMVLWLRELSKVLLMRDTMF